MGAIEDPQRVARAGGGLIVLEFGGAQLRAVDDFECHKPISRAAQTRSTAEFVGDGSA
jgi:hypothetical protein